MNTEALRRPLPLWIRGVIAISFAAVCFVSAWMFRTVNILEDRMTTLETKLGSAENEAQWMRIRQQAAQLRQVDKEICITQRMFGLLLEQDKLKIKGVSWPEVKPIPKPGVPAVKHYKRESMDEYQRIQQAPRTPK